MENLTEHIEQLLKSKDFESLDKKSQKEVLKIMSREEYARYRRIASEGGALRGSEPDELYRTSNIRSSLMAGYDEKYATSPAGFFHKILNVKTPVYQPALAVSVLLFFFYFLFGSLEPEAIQIIEKQTVHDTVYIEKEIPRDPDTTYISFAQNIPVQRASSGKSRMQTSKEALSEIQNFEIELTGRILPKAPDMEKIMKSSQAGRTLKDDSSMKKYLVASQ